MESVHTKLSQVLDITASLVRGVDPPKVIKTLVEPIGMFLEADAVAVNFTLEEGVDIKAFWSVEGKVEIDFDETGFHRLVAPIEYKGTIAGFVEAFYKKERDISPYKFLCEFLGKKLSMCLGVYLEGRELTKKLEYFHVLFNLGNLFRKTLLFRKRVELSLWALCNRFSGFGFPEAYYFIWDEEEGRLRGFIGLTSESCVYTSSYTFLPSDACRFVEIGEAQLELKERSFSVLCPFPIQRENVKGLQLLEHQVVALPVLVEEKILGCFVIGIGRDLKELEKEMLSLFAQEVALAFESAKLQETLRKMVDELKEARARFTEAEKLKTLGEFLARIVHDIKNPLVAVAGLAKRLHDKFPEDYPEKKILKLIHDETQRALSILTEVLTYVREPVIKKSEFDINEVIDDIIFMESTALRDRRIVLSKKLDRSLPKIEGDPAQIRQVLLNLITNAIQAMEKGGTLIIRTALERIQDKEYVKVEISDTGGGIPPDVMPNIFNPFFTTKSTGTGLGLSTAKRIVEMHGGFIECINNYPIGATFLVYLPVKMKDEG